VNLLVVFWRLLAESQQNHSIILYQVFKMKLPPARKQPCKRMFIPAALMPPESKDGSPLPAKSVSLPNAA
jgi:hypothetical protein